MDNFRPGLLSQREEIIPVSVLVCLDGCVGRSQIFTIWIVMKMIPYLKIHTSIINQYLIVSAIVILENSNMSHQVARIPSYGNYRMAVSSHFRIGPCKLDGSTYSSIHGMWPFLRPEQ